MRSAAYPTLHDRTNLLIGAVRCWRRARLRGRPVQPQLAELFSECGCQMLAPVVDALLRVVEVSAGRPIAVGVGSDFSRDEHGIVTLLVEEKCRLTNGGDRGLRVAVLSARIMLAMSFEDIQPAG